MASLLAALALTVSVVTAQLSTSSSTPPLQWINLSQFASGSAPGAVKDAAIGFDLDSRNLLIFGGESSSGVASDQTFLLDLQTLRWSSPTPPSYGQTPPARSLVVGGGDYASNYRGDYFMYGGKGSDGSALSDAWSFDFGYSFWSPAQVDTSEADPGPRYGASGGLPAGLNPYSVTNALLTTTMLLVGGTNGTATFEDAYQLIINGTLSPNNPNSVTARWSKMSPTNAAGQAGPQTGQASTVLASSELVVFGGCNATASTMNNATCALNNVNLLAFPSDNVDAVPQWNAPASCPAGSYGAVMAPNLNSGSTSFTTQVFMMFGAVDNTVWTNPNGVSGEVDILDTSTGTWARIIPSGTSYPSARIGASAVSWTGTMVGGTSIAASDTIIFGGQNVSNGEYLNDIWLLRAYNGVQQGSGPWTGYGNGQLEDNVNATGTGVVNQYLTQCASRIQPATPTTSGSSATPSASTTAPPTSSSPSSPSLSYGYDTSTAHKTLSGLSIALFLPALLLLRASSGPQTIGRELRLLSIYLAGLIGIIGYVTGVAGFVLGLTGTVPTSTLMRRASMQTTFLKTAHGQAGLALFISLYILVPVWAAGSYCFGRRDEPSDSSTHARKESNSTEMTEKNDDGSTRAALVNDIQQRYTLANTNDDAGEAVVPPARTSRRISSPTIVGGRLRDWVGHSRRHASESALVPNPASEAGPSNSPPPLTAQNSGGSSFEVVNRPRRISGSTTRLMPNSRYPYPGRPIRTLSDVSWLQRRQHVGDIAELDLAMNSGKTVSHMSGPEPTTPGSAEYQDQGYHDPLNPSSRHFPDKVDSSPGFPSYRHILFHSLLFATVTFGCIFNLVTLRSFGPVGIFIAFLVWTMAFYALLVSLAWFGRPTPSSLVIILSRLRGDDQRVPPPAHEPVALNSPAFGEQISRPPSTGLGPYAYHQPPYRRANSHEEDAFSSSHHPLSVASEEVDEDEDDEQRQRQIEAEMSSRDVVVMTVPRRALHIVNV